MSPRWIRRAVLATFVVGIAGMIAASIAERTGAAITAGLITAVAMLCLVLVTSVAPAEDFGSRVIDEDAAAEVEERVADLVTSGADEAEVRSLVRRSTPGAAELTPPMKVLTSPHPGADQPSMATQRWTSRAIARYIEAGNSALCSECGLHVQFRARLKVQQVICNVYERGRWDRVEHFHRECYETAGQPFGPADESQPIRPKHRPNSTTAVAASAVA